METVANIHEFIAKRLKCDYGIIVDRQADYSLLPVPVFQFLNAWAPLTAIAIVAHRPMSKTIAQIDKGLSRKPLAIFDNIDDAQLWLNAEMGSRPAAVNGAMSVVSDAIELR